MKKALIIVDLQKDFCEGGSLAVAGGNSIVEKVNKQMNDSSYDLIVATKDWHPKGHMSFASSHGKEAFSEGVVGGVKQMLWTDHCVKGTDGAEFHDDLDTRKFDLVITKGRNLNIDSYSAFFENDKKTKTGLSSFLKDNNISHLDILGLALDVCVRFTVEDALSEGFSVSLLKEMTKAVDENSVFEVLDGLEKLGAEII